MCCFCSADTAKSGIVSCCEQVGADLFLLIFCCKCNPHKSKNPDPEEHSARAKLIPEPKKQEVPEKKKKKNHQELGI
jgi:hypothetical protein